LCQDDKTPTRKIEALVLEREAEHALAFTLPSGPALPQQHCPGLEKVPNEGAFPNALLSFRLFLSGELSSPDLLGKATTRYSPPGVSQSFTIPPGHHSFPSLSPAILHTPFSPSRGCQVFLPSALVEWNWKFFHLGSEPRGQVSSECNP
ncbi:hypothetical protein STEG23_000778, partial [Scotinomys teguina]